MNETPTPEQLQIRELLARAERLPLDTQPGFNARVIARFEFLGPEPSWLKPSTWTRPMAITFAKWILLPALATAGLLGYLAHRGSWPFERKAPLEQRLDRPASLPGARSESPSGAASPDASSGALDSAKPDGDSTGSTTSKNSKTSSTGAERPRPCGAPSGFSAFVRLAGATREISLRWSAFPPNCLAPRWLKLERQVGQSWKLISSPAPSATEATEPFPILRAGETRLFLYRLTAGGADDLESSVTTTITLSPTTGALNAQDDEKKSGSSSRSNEEAPPVPTGFAANWTAYAAKNAMRIRWTPPAGTQPLRVQLEARAEGEPVFQAIATVPASAREFLWEGAFEPNTLYSVRARTLSESGATSEFAAPLSLKLALAPAASQVTARIENERLLIRWAASGASETANAVIHADLNHSGMRALGVAPARAGVFSLPFPLTNLTAICAEGKGRGGCGAMRFSVQIVDPRAGAASAPALGVTCPLNFNNDEFFNDTDDLMALNAAVQSGSTDLARFDVNGDGSVNSLDQTTRRLLAGEQEYNKHFRCPESP